MATKTVSHDDDHLDFSKLEKEVQNAVISEDRYWVENSAKIRAVEEKVATYDQFRERVLAAHLKPLEKEDKISSMGKMTQVWNQAAGKKTELSEEEKSKNGEDKLSLNAVKLLKSGQEFAQLWKRYCKTSDEKRQFLYHVGPQKVVELFRTEISGGLLGHFLDALQHFKEGEESLVLNFLKAFTQSQRFSLSLAFLSKTEKSACSSLFTKLRDIEWESSELQAMVLELEIIYCGSTN